MANHRLSMLSFFHLNLLHWNAARKRILLFLIFAGVTVALVFSMFAIREANLNDLLVYYENKNQLKSNGSPTVAFSTEIDYDGFPLDYAESISDYVFSYLQESELSSVADRTFLVLSIQIDVTIPGYNRLASSVIGGIPDEIFSKLDLGLTEGYKPANSAEVVDIGLFDRLNLEIDPGSENNILTGYSLNENQTMTVVGQTDDESFLASFEALFPPDLMQDATDWDLMTSMDF
ncbi:MAG: hypothetical protein ACFFB3_23775, partial [Candidatus Hodarchaeota archaeon]